MASKGEGATEGKKPKVKVDSPEKTEKTAGSEEKKVRKREPKEEDGSSAAPKKKDQTKSEGKSESSSPTRKGEGDEEVVKTKPAKAKVIVPEDSKGKSVAVDKTPASATKTGDTSAVKKTTSNRTDSKQRSKAPASPRTKAEDPAGDGNDDNDGAVDAFLENKQRALTEVAQDEIATATATKPTKMRKSSSSRAEAPSRRSKMATSAASTSTAAPTIISSRPRLPTSGAANVLENKKERKRAPVKSKETQRMEQVCLANVWPLMGARGGGAIRKQDIEALITTAGGRVSSDAALDDFLRQDMGGSSLNENQFVEKSSAFFNNCVPSEDCREVWQMVGGSQSMEGVVTVEKLGDLLAKFGCRISPDELKDLVSHASFGTGRLAYEDFVRALFPTI